MNARIYSYGCLEPTRGHTEAVEQLRLAARYRNQMAEAELLRRSQVAAATQAEFPRLVELEQQIEQLNAAIGALDSTIRAGNADARRKRATPVEQQRKRELREQRSALYDEQRQIKLDAYGPEEIRELRAQIKQATKENDVAMVAELEGRLVEETLRWQQRVPGAARLRDALEQIETQAAVQHKALRAANNLYWGTYLCVEDAASTFRQGAPPAFKRYTGEGRLGVQIQGGISVTDLLACTDQRIQLDLLPEGAVNRSFRQRVQPVVPDGHPHHNHSRRRANLWFRIGSTCREVLLGDRWVQVKTGQQRKSKAGIRLCYTLTDGTSDIAEPGNWRGEVGSPIWCVVPLVYHRNLPEYAQIKQVYLHRIQQGSRWQWKASFVLSSAESFQRSDLLDASGCVAVNLGWRTLRDGSLRVAYWHGDDGKHGELIVPQDKIAALWDKPCQLQEVRSLLLTEAIERLARWCDEQGDGLPMSFQRRLRNEEQGPRTLGHWRSSQRLSRLIEWWRCNRFAGDEEIFGWMEGWQLANPKGNGRPIYVGFRRQEKHLRDWENSLREKASNWRKNLYREFALMLAKQYRTLLLAGVNWRQLSERPEAEDNTSENATAKFNARIASPGIIEQSLRNRFSDVLSLDAENLTQTCANCGKLDGFDAAVELARMCRHCHTLMDQDQRHCLNLLHASSEAMKS